MKSLIIVEVIDERTKFYFGFWIKENIDKGLRFRRVACSQPLPLSMGAIYRFVK
ncbi:MAG: hypothetical protein LBF34_02195 [Puniceicoccales bacterium]|jgi:hypothetical protein|nr:hypothetical protein [Puniceicoccales bacterium]